jgi:EAL domain-containing protein (putative c-di-GMP-specific phosphodiesterase class I)
MKTPAIRLLPQNIQHWWQARKGQEGDTQPDVMGLLERKALTTVFQPMVDLRSGSVMGHEALIRVPRSLGEMTYEDLIKAAKEQQCQKEFELGCMEVAIERWLVDRPGGQLFVNFSARTLVELQEGEGIDTLLQVLRKHRLQPKRMGLDITGYTRVANILALVDALKPLRAAGMSVALDDFKVTEAGLRVWTKVLPTIVKMAARWTEKIDSNAENSAMVASLVRQAQNHECLLLAKSVEVETELRALRGLGVDLAQGFFLGSPAPDPITSLNVRARTALGTVSI